MTTSIAFIDARIDHIQTLVAGLPADTEVVRVDGTQDGLSQIAAALAGRGGIDAIHLLGHGAPGRLFMGDAAIDLAALDRCAPGLHAIAAAMIEDGAILLYGCEVAQGAAGRRFVDTLAQHTGLKVAAASHKVGAREFGGDWSLDYMPQPVARTLAMPQWPGVLANQSPAFTGVLSPTFVATGSNSVSLGDDVKHVATAIGPDGTQYVAYDNPVTQNNTGKVSVAKLDNGAWVQVGSPEFSLGTTATRLGLVVDQDGTPYVMFCDASDGGIAKVMKFTGNGASGWEQVGGALSVGSGAITEVSLQIANDGSVYAAFTEATSATTYAARLLKFDGANWSDVGTALSPSSSYMYDFGLAPTDQSPYVVVYDASTGNGVLKQFDGANWVQVGGTILSFGSASLAFKADGTPVLGYISYTDSKYEVATWNGTAWAQVGGVDTGITTSVWFPEIAVDAADNIYLVSGSYGTGYYTLKMFDGTAWSALGGNLGLFDMMSGGFAQLLVTPNGEVSVVWPGATSPFDAKILTGSSSTFLPLSAAENQTGVTGLTITDPENDAVTLSIVGGADQAKFQVVGNALQFVSAPDYETPTDSGANNIYEVQLTATDAQSNATTVLAKVQVANVVDGGGGGDTTPPVFQSAATSTDGSKVILTYDGALNATTAAASAFAVTVGGSNNAVTAVTINGSTVELTLTTAATAGKAITVAYTDPTAGDDANAIQDATGNDAASLAGTSVTNNAVNVHIDNATDAASIDPANGVSFSEAIAIAAADASGSNRLYLDSSLAGQTVSMSAATTLGETVSLYNYANGATLSGGTLSIGSGNNLVFTDNSDTNTLNFNGVLSGAGGISNNAYGTIKLGGTNTYSGTTTLYRGTLEIAGQANLGSGAVSFASASSATPAMLAINTVTGHDITISKNIALTNNKGGIIQVTGDADGVITELSGVISGTASGDLKLQSQGGLWGGGGVMPTLKLSGTNSFNGKTIVDMAQGGYGYVGNISIAGDANLGTGTLEMVSGGLIVTADATIDNAVILNNMTELTVGNGKTVTFSGNMSGAGGLLIYPNGSSASVILTGTNTNAAGVQVAYDATLTLNDADGLSAIADTAGLSIGSNATAILDQASETIGVLSLSSGGSMNIGANSLTVAGTNASTFSGSLVGSGNLIIQGANTFRVTSSSAEMSGFSGTTTVNGNGCLQLDSYGNLGGAIVVDNSGLLMGSGTALGAVTVKSGGTLGAGDVSYQTTVADLDLQGGLTAESGSTLHFTLNGATANTLYDQIKVQGAVNITGATLTLAGTYAAQGGNTFTLIANDGSDAVVGTFNGINEGDTVTLNGRQMQISYAGGDGNDIVFTAIDGTAPAYQSAATNAAGTKIILTYDEAINATTAAASAFAVTAGGGNNPVTAVTVNGNTIELTLTTAITAGQAITVGYTDPTAGNDANAIQDTVGNDAASINPAVGVTNSVDTAAPLFQSAATDAAGTRIILTYDGPLFATTAAAGAFAVSVGGTDNAVTAVTINGNTIELTLTTAIASGQAVTLGYTDPTAGNDANAVQDAAGNDAVTLSSTSVTNTVPDTTAPLFQSAATDAAGTRIILTYDGPLFATSAAAGAFAVSVGGADNAVTAVTINGNTVELTLTTAITSGQAVTLGYTDPTTGNDANAVQDAAGNDALSFDNTAVTNTVPAPAPAPAPEPAPTPTPTPADDGDNVPTTTENQVPTLPSGNGTPTVAGDGNGDGLADSAQANVTSVPFLHTDQVSTTPNAPATFVTLVANGSAGGNGSNGGNTGPATLTNVAQTDAPADLPDGITMPLGLISFTARVSTPTSANGTGSTETFSLFVDADLGVNGYWKQDSSGTWVNLASRMTKVGDTVRLDFQIQDGGEFDADHTVNGSIVDPGAVAYMPLSIANHSPDLPHDGFWF